MNMTFKAHLDLLGFAPIPHSNPAYRIDVDGRVMDPQGYPVTITLDANNKWQFSHYFDSDKVDQSIRNDRLKTPIEMLETPESSVTTTEHESADVNV
jgi:hypothetical protein